MWCNLIAIRFTQPLDIRNAMKLGWNSSFTEMSFTFINLIFTVINPPFYYFCSALELLSYGGVTIETFALAFPDIFSDLMHDDVLCKRLENIGE